MYEILSVIGKKAMNMVNKDLFSEVCKDFTDYFVTNSLTKNTYRGKLYNYSPLNICNHDYCSNSRDLVKF